MWKIVAAGRLSVLGLLALAMVASATPASTAATAARHPAVQGADISWPNCPKGEGIRSRRSKGEPMPTRSARFVVLGLTNGPGFHANPCLANQLAWVNRNDRLIGAYALTTYPGPKALRRYGSAGPYPAGSGHAALRNTGYAEAGYNVRTMATIGLKVAMVWVDVEPYPVSPWSRRHTANRAVVSGVIRGYRDAGYQVGLYTYANGWRQVVGAWRLPKIPTWSTIGLGTETGALRTCTHGPSGGATWLAQWWRTKHRDFDVVCPGRSPRFTGPTAEVSA
jgi:hypothetical protein